ncbi:hypothetical protein LIER_13044 [Lithospermum erythrorhizon]|uniref:Uncharacterized protein n=1 Tax=Lithospermum erythrorhizon TaxID=34254 RepID=A0AAV3NT77_LITER
MSLETNLSSPHRRTNPQFDVSSPTYSKKASRGSEWESCSILFQRHRFLLTAIVLLTFLCTVYLYFAITLGGSDLCSEFSGARKASCRLEQAKASIAKGKMKFF